MKKKETLILARLATAPLEATNDVLVVVTKVNPHGVPNREVGHYPRLATEQLLEATGWREDGELIDGDVVSAYWRRDIEVPEDGDA